jgi:hypothetical protein
MLTSPSTALPTLFTQAAGLLYIIFLQRRQCPPQKEQAQGLLTLRPTRPWDESAVEACKNCSIQIGTEHFIPKT